MKARTKPRRERPTMKVIDPIPAEQQSNPTTRTATGFPGGWLHGTVVGIEPTRDLLFLRSQETRKKRFIHWAPETQFVVAGHLGSSADLHLGQRVRLHCRLVKSELEADNISIEPSDYPSTPK